MAEAVYGQPETMREAMKTARVVGMAGCYPTSIELGLAPLMAYEKAHPGTFDLTSIIADSKSGISGAGNKDLRLTFVPHLLPVIRGIHSTIYLRFSKPGTELDVQTLFEKRYADEPFVDVMPAGSTPETRSVRGSNFARIAVHRPQGGDLLVILVVEDNLVKGAAGQAVQAMNLMAGIDEKTGLYRPATTP